MNETLQKRIEEAAVAIAPFNRMSQKRDYFIKGATFALQNQWISVDEALPPHKPIGQNQRFSLPVLLINNNDVTTAYIDSYDFEQPSENVTHWTPIPELKGGKE